LQRAFTAFCPARSLQIAVASHLRELLFTISQVDSAKNVGVILKFAPLYDAVRPVDLHGRVPQTKNCTRLSQENHLTLHAYHVS